MASIRSTVRPLGSHSFTVDTMHGWQHGGGPQERKRPYILQRQRCAIPQPRPTGGVSGTTTMAACRAARRQRSASSSRSITPASRWHGMGSSSRFHPLAICRAFSPPDSFAAQNPGRCPGLRDGAPLGLKKTSRSDGSACLTERLQECPEEVRRNRPRCYPAAGCWHRAAAGCRSPGLRRLGWSC
jgi:hypothetical protein